MKDKDLKSLNFWQKTGNKVIYAFIFIFPLFFNAFATSNPLLQPKAIFSLIILGLLLLIASLSWASNGETAKFSKINLAITFLALAVLVSGFFAQGHKYYLLYQQTGLILWLLGILWLSVNFFSLNKKTIYHILAIDGFLVAILQILNYFELLNRFTNISQFAAKTFSSVGDPAAVAVFLIFTNIISVVISLKSDHQIIKPLGLILSTTQIFALVLAFFLLIPKQPSAFHQLPISSGWSIALDGFKTTKGLLIGSGIDNFNNVYNLYRPQYLNSTPVWNLEFYSSTNVLLTITTTTGLFGLLSFLLLFIYGSQQVFKQENKDSILKYLFIVNWLIFLLLPPSIAYWQFFIVLYILIFNKQRQTVEIKPNLEIIKFIPLAISVIILFIIGINSFKIIEAEVIFAKSLNYSRQNRGGDAYNSQKLAIDNNPYEPRYRVAYARTSLAVANALTGKKDLSDEDRKLISNLISQSIREAKNAVSLQPQSSLYWVNLAEIYRNLLNFADTADQWAVSTYVQAIKLSSTNPQLRLDFGSLFYALGKQDEAINQYKQAILLKPDFTNAYYNLSYAYRGAKRYQESYANMQNVLSLLDPNEADYEKAKQELTELAKLLPASQRQATQSAKTSQSKLTKPEVSQPALDNKLPLENSQQLQPPIPSPTPTLTPTPSPQPIEPTTPEASGSANATEEDISASPSAQPQP